MKDTASIEAVLESILDGKASIIHVPQSVDMLELIVALETEGSFAPLIDRAPIFNKETLLHALYQSCMFPAYFGFNWDALEDSLSDFAWLESTAYILVFQNFTLLKDRAPEVAETFLEVVEEAHKTRLEHGSAVLKLVLLDS